MSTIAIDPTAPTVARSASRSVRRPEARPQLRLTRRGRVVVFAAGLLVAFVAGILLASGSLATSEKGEPQIEVVTVAPGDTLWDIASDAAAAAGTSDVRSMMDRITDLNALESSMVLAGQDLRVPTAG